MKILRTPHISRFLAITILSFTCLAAIAQDYRVLHHFVGGTNGGAKPYGSLIQSGPALYGMTRDGGANDLGTVFKMNTDGPGFTVLHSFISATNDGQQPFGSLIQSGPTLYGLATSDNASTGGTVFQVNTNGADFQVLRRFAGSDGVWPYDTLVQSGGVLYGMNTYGGSGSGYNGKGTIFRINADGTDFQVLHTFSGASDGTSPHGSLLVSGSTLYGMARAGGSYGRGTVFRMNTNGTDFQVLHTFAGGSQDGSTPCSGSLVQSGEMLYGMTYGGGNGDKGTLFRINTNGTGFELLRKFAGGSNDGQQPYGSLIQSGNYLYAMTQNGGAGDLGTIFQIKMDGTGFQLLHQFAGADGRYPCASLHLSGSTLYGMASEGGSNNLGVIFALDLPVPTLAISRNGTNVNLSWNTNCPDYTLESTGHLTNAWTPVPGVTGYSATLPLGPATNQFFRLRR